MAIFRREKSLAKSRGSFDFLSLFRKASYTGDGTANYRVATKLDFSSKEVFLKRFLLTMLLIILLVISSFIIGSFSSPFVVAELEGCYFYAAGSEDLVCLEGVSESLAQADCDENSDCDYDSMFIPGVSCDSYDECELVLCSVDCDYHSSIVCTELGGVPIESEEEEELWCSSGCCTVGDFCEYVSLRYECVERAEQQGLSEEDITIISGSEVSPSYCQTNICGVALEDASLMGVIYDEIGEVLSGVELELSSSLSDVSASDGSYIFTRVSPGSYILRASLDGYKSSSHTISLDSAEEAQLDIILSEEGETHTLSGFVESEFGDFLGSVSICYEYSSSGSSSSGSEEDCSTSLSDGGYSFESLASGDYTFTLSKYGYLSTEVEVSISSDTKLNLVIASIEFQGVSGFTFLDENGDGSLATDGSESTVYGAGIYIDGILLGNSEYSDGDYSAYLEKGDYTIFASYQDYVSDEYDISIVSGETTELNLLLSKVIGECSFGEENDQKSVEELLLEVVVGEEEVVLSWEKPCAEVSGYKLERNSESYQSLSPLATSFVDLEVEWGESYEYSIWAVYTDGPLGDDGNPQVRFSESSADASVTLGSNYCEGRESGEQFCLFDDSDTSSVNERKYVYSCDEENNFVAVTDCKALDDSDSNYFCSAIGDGSALCKNAGECDVLSQEADPFGLYYQENLCYGSEESSGFENFCYFDYSHSTVDACYSCEEVSSCFDYQSEDACSINNCLGQECAWVDSSASSLGEGEDSSFSGEFLDYSAIFPVKEETGHGYCVPVEEEIVEEVASEFCSLCGPDANLFENNYCMPQVCNNLGACFSDSDASECLECGGSASTTANCYTYNSELECSGGQNVQISSGIIVESNDQCSWNVCAWQESSSGDTTSVVDSFFADTGYCFKDGNGDGIDDCSEFTAGEYSFCKVDVVSPETTVVTEGFEVVSHAHSEVVFSVEDSQNPLSQLGYCLVAADASTCNDFEYVDYEGLLSSEELTINFTNSSFILGSVIDGESYLLRYFSIDKYYNQETVKETYVFIDTENPSFEIEYLSETDSDISSLSVYLSNMNEAMSCTFSLEEILPSGDLQEVSSGRDEEKEANFESLEGVIYDLKVNCVDDYGNIHIENEEIVFDLEQDVTLIYPEYLGVVSSTSIEFAVETAVSSVCTLYDTDSGLSLASFEASEDGKSHETEKISGFYEADYAGDVMVVCSEQLTAEVLEDYFHFIVDFTGPDTQIVLSEGDRSEEPTDYNWQEYFIETVNVNFECSSDGFDCASTFYCLGEECEYASADGYEEFSSEVLIEESTNICYYSVDSGGLFGYPDCGEIIIEGYGLILVSPEQYTFEDEIWGVSNQAIFDWAFTTKVDTGLCTYDFNNGFDIYSQPEYKTVEAESENYYVYPDFPGEVLTAYDERGDVKTLYVACEDYRGEAGPATIMNLEYDPSAPEIESAIIDPDHVTEGIETFFYVDTDDKTVCKFSDVSLDDSGSYDGSYEFDTMEFSFEEADENVLDVSHESDFEFSFSGAQKDFVLAAQCKNGAGDLSEAVAVEFEVDYSVEGYIVSSSPSGHGLPGEYNLEVQTSKNAICETDSESFNETGGTSHSLSLGELDEGEYQYAVSCRIGEVSRGAEISFVVDATAPEIEEVDDGSYSCSLDEISFVMTSLDTDIDVYYYEVYEGKSSSMDTSLGELLGDNFTQENTGSGSLVTSGSFPNSEENSSISVSLTENSSYYVKVSAQDLAGNIGSVVESDGFIAIDESSSICQLDDDEPSVVVNTGSSCSHVAVSLDCDDELGCSEIYYGQSGDSVSCEASEIYYGGALSFESSGWICYTAVDVNGNNITGSELIPFSDDDGDGIANSCDLCSSSSSGVAVDSDGCAYGEVQDNEQTDDYDNDGLPDKWEKLYDQTSCSLSYLSVDSDSNGVMDGDEDYDNDGLANYEEYRNGYNPCLSDADSSVVDDTEAEKSSDTPSSDIVSEEKRGVVGVVLFILGILMIVSGVLFLLHYYLQTGPGRKVVQDVLGRNGKDSRKAIAQNLGTRVAGVGATRRRLKGSREVGFAGSESSAISSRSNGLISGLRNKVLGLRRSYEGRKKVKLRKGVFDEFTAESPHLGEFEKHIRARGDSLGRLDKLTDSYSEHRGEVRNGLKAHEKSVFDKLDKISREKNQAAGGINEVASKKDAQDIFKKLRKLSDQRKQ